MGHALVALASSGLDPVPQVSIIPRGLGALGYTIQGSTEDRFLVTRRRIAEQDGDVARRRAAELIVFDHLSTGAADHFRPVTDTARSMVTRYGMSEKVGDVAYDSEPAGFAPGAFEPYQDEILPTRPRRLSTTARTLLIACTMSARSTSIQHGRSCVSRHAIASDNKTKSRGE
jgi:ATP-dependent Zn protease